MKKILFILPVLTLLLAGCKKDDEATIALRTDWWRIPTGTKYTQDYTVNIAGASYFGHFYNEPNHYTVPSGLHMMTVHNANDKNVTGVTVDGGVAKLSTVNGQITADVRCFLLGTNSVEAKHGGTQYGYCSLLPAWKKLTVYVYVAKELSSHEGVEQVTVGLSGLATEWDYLNQTSSGQPGGLSMTVRPDDTGDGYYDADNGRWVFQFYTIGASLTAEQTLNCQVRLKGDTTVYERDSDITESFRNFTLTVSREASATVTVNPPIEEES